MALTLARPEGNPPGGSGLALFYVETARRRRRAERHPGQPPEGQARHAQGADRGARRSTARRAIPVVGLDRRRQATSRRCSTSRARGTRSARSRGMRRGARARARLRATPRRVRRAARGEAAPRRHARRRSRPSTRARSSSRSAPSSSSARERGGRARASARARSLRLLTPIAKLTTAQAGGRGRERGARGVRRRGLRRGHRPAAAPARRAGAADLGGHDERALARRAARARQGRRPRGRSRAEVEANVCRARRTPASPSRPRPRARPSATRPPGSPEAMSAARRLEAGARRFAMTLGRASSSRSSFAHAQWCLDNGHGPRTAAAARRFALNGVDQILDHAARGTEAPRLAPEKTKPTSATWPSSVLVRVVG